MKKIQFTLILLLLCSMFFCACNNKQDVQETPGEISDPEIVENTVSGIAKLCYGEGETMYGVDKENKVIFQYDVKNGEIGEKLVEAEGIFSFCYGNNSIYYISLDKLYEFSLETGKTRELFTFDGETYYFTKMVTVGNSVFMIRKHQFDDAQAEVRHDLTDGYNYEGEALLAFHLATETMETVPIPNMKYIAAKNDSELLIYAYDGEGGFYFTTYQVEEKAFSEKQYRSKNVQGITDIAYDPVEKLVFFTNGQNIMVLPEDRMEMATCVYEGKAAINSLQCCDGITYALETGAEEQVISLANNTLNLSTPILKAYTLSKFNNTPSNGFQIEYEEISAQELTTKILAGDTDYDFLLLHSQWDLGYHVSRIGAYAELNDIPGVKEYLEECHSFAGEAASTSEGSIWMLPYEVEATVFCYNEPLLQEMGLTLSDMDTMAELWALVEQCGIEKTAYTEIPATLPAVDMLRKYHANYGIVDGRANYYTDLFQHILSLREQYEMQVNYGVFESNTFSSAYPAGGFRVGKEEEYKEKTREVYKNTLFMMKRSERIEDPYSNGFVEEFDFIHAAPMPDLEEGVNLKEEVQVQYIVVNPNSDKLPWVKLYVEKLCEELRADETSFMLKNNTFPDKPLYNEIQEILSDARVTFLYPSGIVSDAIYQYLIDGKSFDETVAELERMMNMYMNE